MDTLRFVHHFFHLTLRARLSLWGDGRPEEKELPSLFHSGALPKRALKSGDFFHYREALAEFLKVEAWEQKAGVKTLEPRDFPPALFAHLPPEKLPALLYLRGRPLPDEKECVAIVGTRYPSELGRDAAANFSAYCGVQGLRVLSGLAKGVDAIAHQENLRLGTIAILGSGVDDLYPSENRSLAEEILASGGSLLSPFPLSQVPLPANFPQRNELIAALSAGTIVIEGNETSGAAVTGKHALAMGKCVVALPQDFRTGFGRGAISLQQAGAVFAANEREALEYIFTRLGGLALPPAGQYPRKRYFSFRDFMAATKKETGEALILLEEAISRGKIEKTGPDRFSLRRKTAPDARR
jgi:DNA protecting protein DprA